MIGAENYAYIYIYIYMHTMCILHCHRDNIFTQMKSNKQQYRYVESKASDLGF
jgi:hypothetical protein